MLAVVLVILGASPEVLDLASLEAGASLSPRVWQFAPALQSDRARLAAARAEAQRATFLPNPSADLGVGTIPIGPTNPVDLKDPLLNVPNLSVGLSVLVELGKRGPRQSATMEAARSVTLEVAESLRQQVFSLDLAIADVAAAEVRVATLSQLVADAEGLVSLQRARAEKGDASPLDADRAQLEQEAVRAQLGEATESVDAALRACSELAGLTCLPFGSPARAAAWLESPLPTGSDITRRLDVRALEASARSADAALSLANNQVVPDLTVHAGYVHDRFVVSGNQQNSLFFGLSLPVPLFDRGQAGARAAVEARRASLVARERLLATLPEMATRLDTELVHLEARHQRLYTQALPLGQSVVERLTAAVARGAAPLQELLLARRSWAELRLLANELDRASYGLRVERARLTGASLPLPEELSDATE